MKDVVGSSLKFSPTFRLLVDAFAFECCSPPFECGLFFGLLHEGLRVLLQDASHVSMTKLIMKTKILVMERHAAARTLEDRWWSQVKNPDLTTEASDVVQKEPSGELISVWLVTTLAALGFLLAMSGWTVTTLIASDPNECQCKEHRA